MDIHSLLKDIAVCEGLARGLREKLSGTTSLGLDCDTVDYRDTTSVKSYLSQGKALLRPLKQLRNVLKSLTRYTEHSIYKIEEKLRPLVLHDGINSLPDEVLAMIFEKAISNAKVADSVEEHDSVDKHDKWDTRTLASVNHRFRNVAIGSRKLWSTLSHEKGKKVFKLFLKRSGDATLTIFMGPRPPKWYMEEVLALGHRWGKVVVTQAKVKLISQLREYDERHRTHQTYPRLQALQINSSDGLPSDGTNLTWNVPTIKFLSCSMAISALSNESFASLSTLEMIMEHTYRMDKILQQLHFMRNLQFLSLTLRKANTDFGNDYPDCDLMALRKLRLSTHSSSAGSLERFLDKINMTNVKEVELDCLETSEYDFGSVVKSIFNPYSKSKPRLRFPSLEHITTIAELRDKVPGEVTVIADAFLRHPKIKSLSFKVPFIAPLDRLPMKDYHLDIRIITIVGCLSGAREFLACLLSHVNPDGTKLSNSLVKLSVWGCVDVTMSFLMDYLPEEKIDFQPPTIAYF